MADQVHSVAGLTALIRERLEDGFGGVWVEGEISNHRLPGSGHHYFTLKDPFAQLACVFFKGSAARCAVRLADGMKVQVYGNLSVYEARGQYQLVAQVVQATGAGDLQARFEALKRRLESEGLFDPARKKPLPRFPTHLGIVTSPTGAAIRDMLNVLARRAPWIRVTIHPARVQGEGAAEELAAGLRAFDRASGRDRPDLVILTRGGGSIEDLWAFNEEPLARAIAACALPVLTGVGHEIDFTIADFVADRREPTPSAAAENAVPDGTSLRRHLQRLRRSLEARTDQSLVYFRRHLLSLRREVEAHEPGRRLRSHAQTLDHLEERGQSLVVGRLQREQARLASAGRALAAVQPGKVLAAAGGELGQLGISADRAAQVRLESHSRRLRSLGELMHSLSPAAVLKRGFSLTTDASGRLLTHPSQVAAGERILTRLADGEIASRVE